jgi:hypothetical protein
MHGKDEILSNGAVNTIINNNTQQVKIDTIVLIFVYLCSSHCDMFRTYFLGHPQAIIKK